MLEVAQLMIELNHLTTGTMKKTFQLKLLQAELNVFLTIVNFMKHTLA